MQYLLSNIITYTMIFTLQKLLYLQPDAKLQNGIYWAYTDIKIALWAGQQVVSLVS